MLTFVSKIISYKERDTQVIAEVIVNHNSKEVDKFYDYLVPEEYIDKVRAGIRVIVPFGRGNQRREAYVFKTTDKSKKKNLKSIVSVVDEKEVFDEQMAKLVLWMRERYLSSYYEILHAIIPSGISVKPEEWIVLEDNSIEAKTESRKKIISLLEDNGGGMEISYLLQFFETNVRNLVNKMCDEGILKKEYRDNSLIKDKVVRVAKLLMPSEEAREIIDILYKRRSNVQAKMLEILSANEFISVADLVRFADGSYNAVNALSKKGYIAFQNIPIKRELPKGADFQYNMPVELNDEQKAAVQEIKSALKREEYSGFLLHGVTGSGKTEVFMNVISEVIESGKQAIMLVPEISLTPQLLHRFKSRFNDRIAVFHSGLSLGEKYDQWKKMRDKEVDIAIGARSAVFAPFSNIGIIIMDEEHEGTYKSETAPRYSTHEIARFRAEQSNAVLLLASATPSIESYYRAKNREYRLLELSKRANSAKMPDVQLVDMRAELDDGNRSIFSRALVSEIEKNLKNKEQTILFLNRRGFSTFVSCRSCGYVAKCPSCSISLTYHKYSDTLKCHYCGYERPNYNVCPSCSSKHIRYFGGGTQKIEEEIKKIFPDASTIRMDVDTTGKKFAHEKILSEFENKNIDILIGTQMVAKGLDFENVTLVGVISADVMLNLDDFRSGEISFSMLEQVTGRAGRAKKAGRAIVQTYSPSHAAIECMKKHDYLKFYEDEIMMRKAMWYPPFCEIVLIGFSAASENLVSQAARFFKKHLSGVSELGEQVKILGPIPSQISKIKNKYRWQIVIKCENSDSLNVMLEDARKACRKNELYKNVSIIIDKNPNRII